MNIRGNISQFQPFRTALLSAFGNLNSISMSTLNSFLKKRLKMNFKKRYRLEPRMTKNIKVRSLCQWAALLQALDEIGTELIYFDEFTISSRNFSCRSWSREEKKDLSSFFMIFLREVSLLRFLNNKYTDERHLGRHLRPIKWRISIMSYFTQRSKYLKKIMNYLFLCMITH